MLVISTTAKKRDAKKKEQPTRTIPPNEKSVPFEPKSPVVPPSPTQPTSPTLLELMYQGGRIGGLLNQKYYGLAGKWWLAIGGGFVLVMVLALASGGGESDGKESLLEKGVNIFRIS